MTPKKLVLNSFRKALSSLEEVLRQPEMNDIVRDATIQRFEYTYEIAWKMIKRHLDWMDVSDLNQFSKKELFRKAAEVDLIGGAEEWFSYHAARNTTAHTYNEESAKEVFEAAKAFAPAARRLLRELEKTHD